MLDDLFSSLVAKVSYKKEAEISGIKFNMRPLSFDQEQRIKSYPGECEDAVSFYDKVKIKVLSYAVYKIDNKEIPEIVEVMEDGKKVTKEKSIYLNEIFNNLPSGLTDRLFDMYIDLKEEIEKKFDTDIKYEWFKTPEERKIDRSEKAKKIEKDKEVVDNKEEDEKEGEKEEEKEIVFKKVEVQE